MTSYKHLSTEERFYIWNAQRNGDKKQDIARVLGRHPSTIGREMKRNKPHQSKMYTFEWATTLVKWRQERTAKTKFTKLNDENTRMIEQLIEEKLSPQQTSAYLKEHHGISISHETIYRYIYSDKARHERLKPFLRQGSKKRRKRYGSGARASNIPNRVCISERPKIVDQNSEVGHIECDTVIGLDRKSVLVTLVDRKTLYTFTSRVYSRSAKVVSRAIIRMLKPYKARMKTLTFDNGSEFVRHEKIAKALNVKTYFAHPYCSWERGINENTNGLLRQYFPKKTDFRKVTWKQVKDAVESLNNRPRKTRNYKTPNQLFNNKFVPLI